MVRVNTLDLTEVTFGTVVFWAALIGIAAWVAYLVYRSMDHPRLVLTPTDDGLRARRRDVILYVVSMPALIVLWWAFFFFVLMINASAINPAQLVIFPMALILAIRTLAFAAPKAAEELAKVIPIALVAIAILDGNVRDPQKIEDLLLSLDVLDITYPALLLLFLYDYLVTAIWYWGWVRWGQPRWAAWRANASHHGAVS